MRPPPAPLWKRLVWLALIWSGSVLALALVSLIIRLWLTPT
jgi:hypothetical protein